MSRANATSCLLQAPIEKTCFTEQRGARSHGGFYVLYSTGVSIYIVPAVEVEREINAGVHPAMHLQA